MSNISRRDLFKFGGIAAAGAASASMLGACSPQASNETADLSATGRGRHWRRCSWCARRNFSV